MGHPCNTPAYLTKETRMPLLVYKNLFWNIVLIWRCGLCFVMNVANPRNSMMDVSISERFWSGDICCQAEPGATSATVARCSITGAIWSDSHSPQGAQASESPGTVSQGKIFDKHYWECLLIFSPCEEATIFFRSSTVASRLQSEGYLLYREPRNMRK